MKGILSGVFWGLVAVLAGLGAVSFIAPLPVTPPKATQTPPAQVAPVAPVEEQQAMAAPETPAPPPATPPMVSATAPNALATPEPKVPAAGAPAAGTDRPSAVAATNLPAASNGSAPTPDIDSATVPNVADGPAALPAPDVAEGGTSAPAGSPAPKLPRTAALNPPQDTPDAALETPANPPAPAAKPEVPNTEAPAELPQAESPAPEAIEPEIVAPEAPAAPGAMRVPAPGQQIKNVPDVRVNRLPTVGGGAVEPAAEEPAPARKGALERYAASFSRKPDAPLFSVILIDEGGEGLDRAALTTFTFPVTFAIDASRPDAAEAMRAYRDAGFEVVMIAGGLPQNATPKDLEVALSAYQQKLPEAVAVMDGETSGFHANRPLLRQLMSIVSDTGQGVITYDKGLNTAEQVARAADVPAAKVFRTLDAQHEPVATIRRYLDRAAFKAGQDGHVIMVGHTYPETVTALFSWALEGEGADLSIAPVSAILRGE